MAGEKWYRVNKPSVIEEVLDGEAVIVNLTTGSYYSTEQSGAMIWGLFGQGATVPEIVAHLRAHHTGVPNDVDGLVKRWLDFLESESLIVGEPLAAAATQSRTGAPTQEMETKTPFVEPKLEKYTDMADLLLLDPIHDVQETGWPRASENTGG
ncbi:MAG TPA: PqqD family protein [Terriglobales bacterium]|nr:PqqD family protein [Terriglobales bacterium]